MREAIEKLRLALEGLKEVREMIDDVDQSWALDHIHLAVNRVATNVSHVLAKLKAEEEETCEKSENKSERR